MRFQAGFWGRERDSGLEAAVRIPGGGGWGDLSTDADGRLGVGWYLGAKVPWRCGGCLSIWLYRTTYLSETQY